MNFSLIPNKFGNLMLFCQAASSQQDRAGLPSPELAECIFIATLRRDGLQPPLTTATREGRATMRTKKAAPKKKNVKK